MTTPATAPRLGAGGRVGGCGIPALSAPVISHSGCCAQERHGNPLASRVWRKNTPTNGRCDDGMSTSRVSEASSSVHASRRVGTPAGAAVVGEAGVSNVFRSVQCAITLVVHAHDGPSRPSASAACECAEYPSSLGCSCQTAGAGAARRSQRRNTECTASSRNSLNTTNRGKCGYRRGGGVLESGIIPPDARRGCLVRNKFLRPKRRVRQACWLVFGFGAAFTPQPGARGGACPWPPYPLFST